MTSRERVIAVIERKPFDRIPVYGWLRANLSDPIAEAFGSVEAFEDRYEFDFAHLFGGPKPYDKDALARLREATGGPIEPRALLDVDLADPDDCEAYEDLRRQIDHHKTQRDRFVYVQTPGIFECLNGCFGIENHLLYLALYPDDLHEVYRRQADWNRQFAMNCLDLGIGMIHVSDDWGAQTGLMFSPETWQAMIRPYHAVTVDAVKARGGFVSLHSDGNVMQLIDEIVALGYDVLHPYQESAGMDVRRYLADYADRFTLMGGLDIQTALGFGKLDLLRSEIERIVRIFSDRGLLLCTSHFVQEHCTVEELVFAYDRVYELVRRNSRQ